MCFVSFSLLCEHLQVTVEMTFKNTSKVSCDMGFQSVRFLLQVFNLFSEILYQFILTPV